jgi:fumarate hydratase subunit alpha
VVHLELTAGEQVRVRLAVKGGGCENVSRFRMLKPSEGRAGVVRFVTQVVAEAGGQPCPPLVVGVGLGGTFERTCLLAKRALFRPLGEANPRPHLAELERELLEAVNRTGVGPIGLGGTQTALAVQVESAPCHIASLPVAVNLDCHSHRHGERVL